MVERCVMCGEMIPEGVLYCSKCGIKIMSDQHLEHRSIGLTIVADKDGVLGKHYNVEYESGNGKTNTFSNTLVNVGNGYFCFSSKLDGLEVVRQDRIIAMTCNSRERGRRG